MAIKSVLRSKLKNKKLLENLEIEIQILKSLIHPHIVSLIDCQQSNNYFHLIMEYCSLGDLSYFIRKRNQLVKTHPLINQILVKYPPPENSNGLNRVVAIHFLKQLASALEFLRSKNLVHRDIKPQNLLLCYPTHSKQEFIDNNYVGNYDLPILKIADFGFARFLPNQSLAETLCGSPLYMAPEILRYEKYNAKADLWSVGAVLYEMCVGRPPFRANNHVELLKRIENAHDNISFPENIEIDPDLKRIIRGLLKLKSIERMSFNEFFNDRLILSDLNEYINESETLDHSSIDENLFISEYLPRNNNNNNNNTNTNTNNYLKNNNINNNAAIDNVTKSPTSKSLSPGSSIPENASPTVAGQDLKATVVPSDKQQIRDKIDSRHVNSNQEGPQIVDDSGTVKLNDKNEVSIKGQSLLKQQFEKQYSTTAQQYQNANTNASVNQTHSAQVSQLPRPENVAQYPYQRPQYSDSASRTLQQEIDSALAGNIGSHNKLKGSNFSVNASSSLKSKSNATELLNEKDYVVVEKKSVEVNALADQLANFGVSRNPTKTNINPKSHVSERKHRSSSSSQKGPSSGDRRFSISLTPSNALSKALVLASTRLFGSNTYLSKDSALAPVYGGDNNSFEATSNAISGSPSNANNVQINNNVSYNNAALGAGNFSPNDTNEMLNKLILHLESLAAKAHAVNLFAQVKYSQLIPFTPSSTSAIADDSDDEDANDFTEKTTHLPPIAIKNISEEGLSLYIKTLSLLAKAMNITSEWWYSNEHGVLKSGGGEFYPASYNISGTNASYDPVMISRLNSLVQWVREVFNECLDRADFIRLKLNEANQRLGLAVGPGVDTDSTFNTKVIAEKLIFDRALEISRNAAVNELVGEDLLGCELAYSTSIWMLEAILDSSEQASNNANQNGVANYNTLVDNFSDDVTLDVEDKAMVQKFIVSIGNRLNVLRKKIEIINNGGTVSK